MRFTLTLTRHPELVSGSIAPLARSKRRQTQPHRKVAPLRVLAIDQIDFPLPVPALEALFSRDCGDHIAEHFEMNQSVDGIFLCETGQYSLSVLPHPRKQIGRYADIQRPVVFPSKDIYARNAFLPHTPECAAKWTLKQVQGDEIGLDSECSSRFGTTPKSTHTNLRHAELTSLSIFLQASKL